MSYFVIRPSACVFGAVGPEVDALALLHTVPEVAMIVATVRPDFDTLSVLIVLSRVLGG